MDWTDSTEDAKHEEEFLLGPKDDKNIMGESQEPRLSEPYVINPEGDHREPRDLQAPIKPSARAVDLHGYTHIPCRSWCNICKAARWRENAHARRKHDDEGGLSRATRCP